MIHRTALSRRHMLAAAGMADAGTAVPAAPAAPASAAPKHPRWSGRISQNGWPIVDGTKVATVKVEGSNAGVALLPGDVATVLLHVARRFHYEVDALASGDVSGHATTRTVTAAYESNYLSGTALAIRPNVYPTGSAGNLFPTELLVVRDILAECDGVVRWGG